VREFTTSRDELAADLPRKGKRLHPGKLFGNGLLVGIALVVEIEPDMVSRAVMKLGTGGIWAIRTKGRGISDC